MKKIFKRIQFFLVITISFFILIFPVYRCCANLSETKFNSPDLGFQNPGQENGLPDNDNGLKVFEPAPFFAKFLLLDINLSKQSYHLFSQTLSLHQKTFVLRC